MSNLIGHNNPPSAQQFAVVKLSRLPPSANNLFATSQRGRFKTKHYKGWLEQAGWELKQQRPGHVPGHYAMTVTAGKVAKRRDLSNLLKALEDLLVKHSVVEDDSLAQKIIIEWGLTPGVHIMVASTKGVG